MRIVNSNFNYNYKSNTNPQFKSKYFEALARSANLKKPLEKMTKGDCLNLLSYLKSIKYRLGITQEEIKELLSKEGLDFLQSTSTFFLQKLDFSENNLPPILLVNKKLIKDAPAAYAPEQNVIYLADSYEYIAKPSLFALLRHEFQHAIQNHTVLRTEGLGEEAVKFYAEIFFESQKDALLNYAKNYSVKELLNQGAINQEGAAFVSELSRALQENNKEYLDSLLGNFKQKILASLKDFREKLIQEKGLIKSGSKQAEFAKEYFNDFKNIDYFNKDGTLDFGKHSFKLTESEAEITQVAAEAEMNQVCFIKQLKNNQNEFSKNKEWVESLDREFEKQIEG